MLRALEAEKFEDTKGVTKSRTSTKDRQYNDQKNKVQKNKQQST